MPAMSEQEVVIDPDVDQEVLDDEPKNILIGIVSQLRKGMDLSRVTLPTFVLEPRSMCERITDFMSHPNLIIGTHKQQDPVLRFVDVVRYYLSGWHIRPKGVKKPYNPVLGEFFRCKYKLDDGSESFYVCEQVSHHPPSSAYFYANPANDVWISGEIKPKSKFLGNSAATLMHGTTRVFFRKSWPGEEYQITLPNIYARGILFGTMQLELGDSVTVKCAKTDLTADIEFCTKGYFSGTYNGIKGKIKRESTGEVLYTIGGKWTDIITLCKGSHGDKTELINSNTLKIQPKIVAPEEQQEEFESRRVWSKVTKSMLARNLDQATEFKTAIEENQRLCSKERTSKDIAWTSRFFESDAASGSFAFNMKNIPADPQQAVQYLDTTLFAPPTSALHSKFWTEFEGPISPVTPASAN